MPKIVDKDERRQALVKAALGVFAERGYHRATIQVVADRAGVSKGSIYDYFRSKDELLVGTAETLLGAIFEHGVDTFENSQAPIRERIKILVNSLLGAVEQWNQVVFVISQVWAELGNDPEQPLHRVMASMYSETADRIAAVFDNAVESGQAPPFPTRAAALSLIAAIDGMLLQAFVNKEEFVKGQKSGFFVDWCQRLVPPLASEVSS